MTARHLPERHDFRPEAPLRRSALLRRVSRCLGRARTATMYLFRPTHLDRQLTNWIFLESEEAGTGTGAEADGGTDAAVSTGRPRAGE